MEVHEGDDGSQQILLETALQGKLLLHWGVQRQGKDGWALPGDSCRPPGTTSYKKRALQTPWRHALSCAEHGILQAGASKEMMGLATYDAGNTSAGLLPYCCGLGWDMQVSHGLVTL